VAENYGYSVLAGIVIVGALAIGVVYAIMQLSRGPRPIGRDAHEPRDLGHAPEASKHKTDQMRAYLADKRSGADTAMTASILGLSDADLIALANYSASR
jgi:hypothetical protein